MQHLYTCFALLKIHNEGKNQLITELKTFVDHLKSQADDILSLNEVEVILTNISTTGQD